MDWLWLILWWLCVRTVLLHELYLILCFSIYCLVILIVTINKTSSVFFPRVCLCRRRRLKIDLPTADLVSPSWPGRDKPPAHAAPIQATSNQLPQGRWQQGIEILRQTTLQTPELTYSRCAFFEAHYFHSFLMDVLVSLHSAYWFSFFSSWSDPWGRDAKQDCPNLAPLFFPD